MLEIRKNIQNGFVPKKREEVSIEQIEKSKRFTAILFYLLA